MKNDLSLWRQFASLFILSFLTACSSGSDTDSGTGTEPIDSGGFPSSDSFPPNTSDNQDSMPIDSALPVDTNQGDVDSADSASSDSGSFVDTNQSDGDSTDSQPKDSDDFDDTDQSDMESEDTAPSDTEGSTELSNDTASDTVSSESDSFEDTTPQDTETRTDDSTDMPTDTESPSSGCSPDLHSRVDESGNIVETCPPDQGCLSGHCAPACTAVAAAHGNVGCDFLIPRPPISMYTSPCYAVFVANNWNKPASIALTRGETTYDAGSVARVPISGQAETSWPPLPTDGVPADQGAVIFLEGGPQQYLGCPVETAIDTHTAVSLTGRGQAWHLVTDTPVTVYDIMPYGGAKSFAPSAGLISPTTAWKTNYLAVVPPFQPFEGGAGSPGSQWGQIVAADDGTVVTIAPSVDLPAGDDVSAAPAGFAASYSLSAGEFLQWKQNRSIAVPMDMTGSVLSANRPISFVGGNEYLCITTATSDGGGCDAAHQQIWPISAWGSQYAVAPYATRNVNGGEESLLYRIVGAKNDTVLAFDPPVVGAPSALEQGERQDFEAVGAFEVKSQDGDHPFYLAQMMSGWNVEGNNLGIGDEEYVNLVPAAQFMSSYIFFTDLTYKTTTLTVSQCDKGEDFAEVRLGCLDAPLTGWKPIGLSGECLWTTVDLVREGIPNGDCRNGPQSAWADRSFGLTVWGLDFAASYAYPAGAMVSKINEVEIPVI